MQKYGKKRRTKGANGLAAGQRQGKIRGSANEHAKRRLMQGSSKKTTVRGAYGAQSHPVDYILGITHEIWEQRGVDLIHQYYAPDCTLHALDGLVQGAQQVVDGTRAYLGAFPDRLLLGEEVIWSPQGEGAFLSSHRIISPMTNLGPSVYGPATGKALRVAAIADCLVEHGVITREWLIRDGLALLGQLGFAPLPAAQRIQKRRDAATDAWLGRELARAAGRPSVRHALAPFIRQVLEACWAGADAARLLSLYAPYAVLHRSPVERHSGAPAIAGHFAALRGAFAEAKVAVDQVSAQPWGENGQSIAVRWGVAARHQGEYQGVRAGNRPVFILGVSHWRILQGRIVQDWTLFDGLGVLAQLV